MKQGLYSLILFIAFTFMASSVSQAQFRDKQIKRSEYTGSIIKKEDPSEGAKLGNLFNMKMTHSYSVNFGTVGGRMLNMNAYTNTMQFFFNEDLTGTVNVSLLHSPFGQSSMYNFNEKNALDIALNAQLDYQISDRMNLHLEVNRLPGGYGFGSPYGRYYRSSPFQSGSIFH